MNCSPRVVFIFSYSLLQNVVSKSALQFKGNSQHDAQEFLLWLLDRVHEDLNRIIHPESKPPRKVNSKVIFIPCTPWIIYYVNNHLKESYHIKRWDPPKLKFLWPKPKTEKWGNQGRKTETQKEVTTLQWRILLLMFRRINQLQHSENMCFHIPTMYSIKSNKIQNKKLTLT